MPSPSPPGVSSWLTGIAAVAADDAWAVGYTQTATATRTLIEHWDGTAWTVVPSPNPGSSLNLLDAVSAAGPAALWAVGATADTGSPEQALTLHWGGTTWTVVPSPTTGGTIVALSAVSARAPSDVWAAGSYQVGPHAGTVTEHWDGSAWAVVASTIRGP